MRMESRHGKGMHDTKERAALLHESSTLALAPSESLHTEQPQRFFPPLVAQGLDSLFLLSQCWCAPSTGCTQEARLGSGIRIT